MSLRTIKFIFCIQIILVIWFTLNLFFQIGTRFEGVRVGGHIFGQHTVDGSTPLWWDAIRLGLLQPGDTLYQLDGRAYQDGDNVSKYLQTQEETTLYISRNNTPMTIEIPVVVFTFEQFIDMKFPNLLMAFCLMVLAWEIFRVNPTHPLNRKFFFVLAIMMMTYGIDVASIKFKTDFISNFGLVLGGIFVPIAGTLMLDIVYQNIAPLKYGRLLFVGFIWVITCMCIISFIMACVSLFTPVKFVFQYELFLFHHGLYYLIFVSSPLLIIARLVFYIFNSRIQEDTNRQNVNVAKALLIGFLAVLPLPILFIFMNFIDARSVLFAQYVDLRYLWLAPLSMLAIAILRYQLFTSKSNITVIIPIVFIASIISTITNAIIWSSVGHQPFSLPISWFFLSFVSLTVAGLIFIYGRYLWNMVINRRLFKVRDPLYDITQVTQIVALESSNPNVFDIPIVLLQKIYDLNHVQLWIKDGAENTFTLTESIPETSNIKIDLKQPINEIVRLHQPTTASSLQDHFDSNLALLIPLRYEQTLWGFLAVGKLEADSPWMDTDLEALEFIADQITHHVRIYYNNQQLIEIRRGIHHIDKQFLNYLQINLGIWNNQYAQNNPGLQIRINRMMHETQQVARNLDMVIQNNWFTLENISELLNESKKKFQLVQHNIMDDIPEIVQHYLYLSLNECITNTLKHRHPDTLKVSMKQELPFIVIDFEGIGRLKQDIADKEKTFGGIQLEKKILKSLGGDIVVTHSPEFTHVVIKIPIDIRHLRIIFDRSN
jgi:hypothetical protein